MASASHSWGQRRGNDDFYQLGPDSSRHDGVPHGEVQGPFTLPSEAYEGTQHTYWAYVPAQYDANKPCSLMVFNDGHAYLAEEGSARATNVIDNLIFRREIPVMIGVFINPGRRPDQAEATAEDWGDRSNNRPTEYNSLDDRYARVIVDELLPDLYAKYNISHDRETHGIGGCSSGAIAAFTVAWERPDHFSKVLSMVGSFTNIRGGHQYPDIIRDHEKKPIRIFLQGVRNDNRGERRGNYDPTRDWFLQNTRMVDALTEKGYDVNYTWSIGRHGLKSGGVILPEMMRWLWRDHPVSTDVTDESERSFNEPFQTTSSEVPLEPGYVSLFNGHDLTGWGLRPTSEEDLRARKRWQENSPDAPPWPIVTEPKSFDGKTSSDDGRYVAREGMLVVTDPAEGRRIQQLWTTREFPTDFTLKLEFRASPNADSGVFVRGKQLQCRDYLVAGPYKELKEYKPQDWNELVIQVTGQVARCTCNGEVLEAEFPVPETGPIGVEGDRGQLEYRNIRIHAAP
ncbi:MAG: DUF1080 domain-containing protein [Planctomycetales bacterium]|nr:DUF1080 domain-containing protein [Planctomycetales bacterium]